MNRRYRMLMRLGVFGVLIAIAIGAPIAIALGQVGPPSEVINQATRAIAVTPSDTVDFAFGPTRGVYIGAAAACNMQVLMSADTVPVTFNNLQVGQFLPLRVKRIFVTGTTCTNILALY
jgi:hypothetical protein